MWMPDPTLAGPGDQLPDSPECPGESDASLGDNPSLDILHGGDDLCSCSLYISAKLAPSSLSFSKSTEI